MFCKENADTICGLKPVALLADARSGVGIFRLGICILNSLSILMKQIPSKNAGGRI